MNPINHYEGLRPNVITQHSWQSIKQIDFHGWRDRKDFEPNMGIVAIFRIKYKQ